MTIAIPGYSKTMLRKVLLISFPVDLGSLALQNNLFAMLNERCDLTHHIFSPREKPDLEQPFSPGQRALSRLREMTELRRLCAAARKEGRTIIFQQISPALFSAPFLHGVRSYISLDWTRKLFEPINGERISPWPLTRLHAAVLNSATGVLAFTDAVAASVINDYGVSAHNVHRISMPFDVLNTQPAMPRETGPVKLLFVGGDFYRKGGDRLVRWFQSHSGPAVELTIMTQTKVDLPPGVRLIRNDPLATAKSEFANHDLFVLPTKYDAFPLAIGEAASAGLGVIASRNALGAPAVIDEGLNGYIVDSDEDLFSRLSSLAEDRRKVERFKLHSRAKMLESFTYSQVYDQLDKILNI